MKSILQDGEKFANHIFGMLVSRIYKEFSKSDSLKINSSSRAWAKEISPKIFQMANEHIKNVQHY